jgi:thiosulfate oxidation carrier complex protein SoxZ
MTDARIQVPAQVRRGAAFEVKLLIPHPMESGFNYTHDGKPIARNVIRWVTCRYNGTEVFRVEPSSGVAANPLFTFYLTAQDSGELVFEWLDDAGARVTARAGLTVTP